MYPILYANTELNFSNNGKGQLADCTRCIVTEERNGIYECEFDYPITGALYNELITNNCTIGVYHDDRHDVQPFDIYAYSAPIDGIVTFYAHHISYRLNRVMLEPFSASTIAEVMLQIPNKSVNYNPFTFWTDKATVAVFNLKHPDNVKAILGGQEGSILDTFGTGEYQYDKFTVRLYANRGVDSGVTIRYGKNMSDILHEKDSSTTYNAIAPYWMDTEGNVLSLPEVYVMSTSAEGNQTEPWTTQDDVEMTDGNLNVLEFNFVRHSPVAVDFTQQFTEMPSLQDLREAAQQYLQKNKPWIPKENVKVDFVQLWQTPEYEDVAALQRVSLCDTVSIYYPELGVIAEQQKVIKVVYNVLLEKYDSIEIGMSNTSLAQTIYDEVYLDIQKALQDYGSVMQAAIEKATNLITGGLGGYVVYTMNAFGQPQEILIMDTPSIDTAVNVIRMNRNGIGFSHNGYQGPYTSAWTIDGEFVADFITAGTLNANIIKTGILSDYAGKNYWNMLTGDLNLQGLITQTLGTSVAELGSVTFKRLNPDTSGDYTYEDLTGIGYKVTAGTGRFANQLVLVSNESAGDYIYAEKRKDGGYNNDLHHRCYYSNWAGVERYIEELIGRNIEWDIYDPVNSVMKACMQLEDDASLNLYRIYRSGSSYGKSAYFIVSQSQINWGAVANNAQLIVHQNSFIVKGSDTCGVWASNGQFYLYASSTVYLRGITTTELKYGTKNVAFQGSSSKRYKHDIERIIDEELNPHRLLSLPAVQFVYNDDFDHLQYYDMKGKLLPGFIAEEVADIYPAAVIHDADGRIESWDERRIIPGMLALIQEQQKKIDDLEERLAKLERMVEKLC